MVHLEEILVVDLLPAARALLRAADLAAVLLDRHDHFRGRQH